MVHTPLKVVDDCARMHVHSFSFLTRRHHSKFDQIKKRNYEEASYTKQHQEVIKKCSALNGAPKSR